MSDTLTVTDVTVSYGGVLAVDSVSFDMSSDEVVGLVGPNGSGKTSLLNALTGLTPCTGTMTLGDRLLRLGDPRAIHHAGISRAFQTPQVYEELTCADNVLLAAKPETGTGLLGAVLPLSRFRRGEAERVAAVHDALRRFGLDHLAQRPAEGLPYGQRRLLELARAIAAAPRFLLLDEPSAGLNEDETEHLAAILQPFRSEGVGIIIVDHKVSFLDSLCDRLLFLQQGRIITHGRPSDVWSDQAVIDAYLGSRTS